MKPNMQSCLYMQSSKVCSFMKFKTQTREIKKKFTRKYKKHEHLNNKRHNLILYKLLKLHCIHCALYV